MYGRRQPRALAALACLAAVLPTGLGAQAPDSVPADTAGAPVFELQGLEATVSRSVLPERRLAASISVVERTEIQRARPTVDIEEALGRVPGVTVDNRYNFALGTRISIRGFGARSAFGVRGVRLLVDGIPLTVADGQASVTNLPLASAGRIEVWKGPASLLYGNAAGGVISVETEEPPDAPFAAELSTTFGDYDAGDLATFWKAQAKVGGRSRGLTYVAAINRMELSGFREFSRTERTFFNCKVRYALDDASYLRAIVNVADILIAQNPGSLPLETALSEPHTAWPNNVRTGSSEAATQAQGGIGYTRVLGEGQLDVIGYGITRELDNPLPFGRFIDLSRRAGGARATYQARSAPAGHEVSLTTGVDLEHQRDDRQERDNIEGLRGDLLFRDQVDQVTAVGPFARAQIVLAPWIEVSGGLRYDAVHFTTDDALLADGDDSGSRTLDQLSYAVGAVLVRRPDLTIFGNVATSFQTPTTTELINAPPEPGTVCCPGGFNPDLEPQTATSIELGARGRIPEARLRYELALYTMDVEELLIPFGIEEVESREFFRNAGETRHRGVELGLGMAPEPLRLGIGYTFSDFIFLDDGLPDASFEDNRVPGVPPHRFTAEVGVDGPSDAFIEADMEWVSAYDVNDANTAENPSYTVVGVRAGATLDLGRLRLSPFVGVANLFNERYNASVVINAFGGRFFEPAPGRNVYLGLTAPIR